MATPSLDDELAPYLDVERDGRTVGAVVGELGDAERGALTQVAMVMFRSDAVRGGRALPVLDALAQEHGVVPVRLAVRRIDPRAFDRQYVTELPLISTGLWLHHRVATAGPTVYAIVTGPAPDGRSLAAALDDLKGASSPATETSAATLRARFARPSSFHVVLHTSEDAGDFLQGAADVFGWATVRNVLAEVAAAAPRRIGPEPLRHLVGELADAAAGDVYDLALSLKRRIVATLSLAAGEPERAVDLFPLADDLAVLDRLYAGCDLGAGALFADRRERFMALARAERPTLRALIDRLTQRTAEADMAAAGADLALPVAARWRRRDDRHGPLELVWASWFLAGHEPYDLDDGTGLVALLERHGIVLAPGGDTLLAAALACDINPAASFGGRRTYPLDLA